MSIRTTGLTAGVIILAAVGGVATSQQPPPSPVAATQIDLPRDRADNAALGAARQDPLAARLRGVLGQDPASAEVLRLADASPVPVLAPADPALLRTAVIYTGDRHYMLVVERGPQVIEIYGATKAFRSPVAGGGSRPATAVTAPVARVAAGRAKRAGQTRNAPAAGAPENLRAERTEYGVDVSFNRFGAAYNVGFICEGQGAPGCSEAEAVAFAASLRLIGGGGS